MKAVVALLIVALSMPAAVVGSAGPAGAQDEDPPPVEISDDVDQPVGGIIPKPNSGVAPDDAGDRGGALQLALLGLIVTFAAVAFFSVRRTSRKALAKRAASDR